MIEAEPLPIARPICAGADTRRIGRTEFSRFGTAMSMAWLAMTFDPPMKSIPHTPALICHDSVQRSSS
jgi:hypothetical protein